MSLIPTASQTVGPYLHLGLTPITIADIARDATRGETIVISGRVLDGEGKPIPDALPEFWQANADGKYAHPEDTQDKPLDGKFIGFGRVPKIGSAQVRTPVTNATLVCRLLLATK